MATPIDESWEYYEPDPEIAELLGLDAAAERALTYADLADRQDNPGISVAARKLLPPRPCKQCGTVFEPLAWSRGVFCSRACNADYRQPKTHATGCPVCGRAIPGRPAGRGGPPRVYCADHCRGVAAMRRHRDKLRACA